MKLNAIHARELQLLSNLFYLSNSSSVLPNLRNSEFVLADYKWVINYYRVNKERPLFFRFVAFYQRYCCTDRNGNAFEKSLMRF